MTGSKIAKRYAKALFALGQEEGSFVAFGKELEQFRDFCSENPDFKSAVSNTMYKIEERKNVLAYVLNKGSFSRIVKNFLYLLLEKNRISEIEAITEKFTALTDAALEITSAEIITARPLGDDTLHKVINSLREMTSKDIRPVVIEEPGLIGGIIVRIEDIVMDGSVRSQLKGLKESFKMGGQTSWK